MAMNFERKTAADFGLGTELIWHPECMLAVSQYYNHLLLASVFHRARTGEIINARTVFLSIADEFGIPEQGHEWLHDLIVGGDAIRWDREMADDEHAEGDDEVVGYMVVDMGETIGEAIDAVIAAREVREAEIGMLQDLWESSPN